MSSVGHVRRRYFLPRKPTTNTSYYLISCIPLKQCILDLQGLSDPKQHYKSINQHALGGWTRISYRPGGKHIGNMFSGVYVLRKQIWESKPKFITLLHFRLQCKAHSPLAAYYPIAISVSSIFRFTNPYEITLKFPSSLFLASIVALIALVSRTK